MIRNVWRWGRILAGGGILALLGWRFGTGAVLNGVREAGSTTFAAALGIGAVTTVLSAWRWSVVARGLGLRLRLTGAVGDYYRSLFLNAVLPGGVLGDVHRAVQHGRGAGDVPRAVTAVVLERFAGQVVLVAAGVTVLAVNPAGLLPRAGSGAGSGAGAATLTLATGAAAALAAGLAVVLRRPWWAGALRRWSGDVRRGLLSGGRAVAILLASAGVLAGHLATFVLAARAAGSSAPLGHLAPLMLLSLLAMTIPVNVAGWGPREGVTAWAFGAAGLGAERGLTVAVTYGLCALIASLPGAAVLAFGWVARFRSRTDPRAHSAAERHHRSAAPRPGLLAAPARAETCHG